MEPPRPAYGADSCAGVDPVRKRREAPSQHANTARSSWSVRVLTVGAVGLLGAFLVGFLSGGGGAKTICYQTVRTGTADTSTGGARPEAAAANCFTVERDGRFGAVFHRDVDAEAGVVGDLLSSSLLPSWLGGRSSLGGGSGVDVRPGHALPGLWDGHGHLMQYGEFLHSVDLFGAASVDEVLARVRRYVDANPGAGSAREWVRGVGWDQMVLGGMPTAAMLEADTRLRGLYVMLDRVDVHCLWASQAVLDLLTPAELATDVAGGEIVREPGLGVLCDNAMDMVRAHWPRPGRDKETQFVRSAMRALHGVGLVGMHDAGVTPAELDLYADLSRRDDWTLRVYAMLECAERNTFCPDEARRLARWDDPKLVVRSVKLFGDGALGSWGSAMLEAYNDRPDMSGSLLVNASTLTQLARSWASVGFQVNIHAIGDLANRRAIDAMEAALRNICAAPGHDPSDDPRDHDHLDLDPASSTSSPSSPLLRACQRDRARFRIEHAQIVHPADQARMRALGIAASVQPTHATSDMAWAEARLGAARTASSAYRMRSFLAAGLVLVLGSDFPVEPPSPFEGLYAAVARRSPRTGKGPPSGGSGEVGDQEDGEEKERGKDGEKSGWHMEEALALDEALDGFTKAPAWAAFMEGKAGVITTGAFADWIVLDEPIESVGVEGLRHVRVRETWVGGQRVYAREEKEDVRGDL